jgi:threonine/homoserine/homoserine lactone efflux protein
MIDAPSLLVFLTAAAILTVTPGIDTAMVLRAATIGGRRPAALASLGIACGCLVWGAATSLGLGALLHASEVAYTLVKFAGAAYLVWLGVGLLWKPRASLDKALGAPDARDAREAFWRGFLTNLLNPKVGMFYVTFLPQFVPVGASVALNSFMLACLHVMLSLAWFVVLIVTTEPLGKFLRRPRVVTILDRLTGGLFVAFGVKLAISPMR